MGINRSTYYAWLAARPAARIRQAAEDELAGEIREIHAGSRGAYGAPRVHAALKRWGRVINQKKVERIMRERDIRGITRRKRRHLTVQDGKAAPAPDLVGRDFTAARTGTKLVGDITYLPTVEGWWYLATVIDLATREVIGYAMADHHRAELVTDALRMAAGRGGLQPGCIMHTDRGSEGGFNWSSQHLRELEVCAWQWGIGSGRRGSIAGRCLRRGGRASRGARTGSGSGGRSRGG